MVVGIRGGGTHGGREIIVGEKICETQGRRRAVIWVMRPFDRASQGAGSGRTRVGEVGSLEYVEAPPGVDVVHDPETSRGHLGRGRLVRMIETRSSEHV